MSKIIYQHDGYVVKIERQLQYDTFQNRGYINSYHTMPYKRYGYQDDILNLSAHLKFETTPLLPVHQFRYKHYNIWLSTHVKNIEIPRNVTHVFIIGIYNVYFPYKMKYLRATDPAVPSRLWYNLKVYDMYTCGNNTLETSKAMKDILARNRHNHKQQKSNLFDL